MTNFVTESMIFGASGLILGAYVDKQFKKLSEKYPENKVSVAALQLLILVLIVYFIYSYATDFALGFQETMSGMAFPAMYFGVQINLFEVAQKQA